MLESQRVIAGRYEVGSLIGRGGMADVYEGVDTRLGRTVAIKLLKSDLANDPSFEARFRQEAQASARMAHPTIVRVYDAGEELTRDDYGNEQKVPYIVMEYVKGELLRDIMHARRLTLQEAIEYASGVLTALEISHRAGVIHRDIKAANVMITDGGQVKVMDFGIARAVSDSSATMAHTSGIVGTAQYFSPEQARGETVDSRTDLYSAGVLLYEMLAGRPPFKGETAVSVAYQHVSEAVPAPSSFDPSITPELDQVVLRALAKNREDRFQSAEEFRENLLAAVSGSPATAPTATYSAPLANVSAQPTEVISSVAEDDFEALFRDSAVVSNPLPTSEATSNTGPVGTAINPFATLGVEIPTDTGKRATTLLSSSGGPSKKLIWTAGSAVAVVFVGLMIWLVSLGNLGLNITPSPSGVNVADVTNQTYTDGYSALTAQGLLVQKVTEANDTIPVDTIIRTDPPAGTTVPERTSIIVYVSSGKNTVLVPSLLNMTESDAATALAAAKLTLGTITQANSASVAAGQVIESDPAMNSQIAEGTAVNLVVSNGKVMVPDVRNLSVSEARSAMLSPEVGFTVSITTKDACTGTAGTIVVDQSILPGLAPQKSAIVLYVACQ